MNEFTALRARAREKRNATIARAYQEWEAALLKIATLEKDLLGKAKSRNMKLSAAVESVIPRDETFSVVDLVASLEALYPGRAWHKPCIDNHMWRLRKRRIVKRLSRASPREPAVYIRVGAKIKDAGPAADMTLLEAIRMVLTRPMTATEIVVAVLEAGYRTTMAKNLLLGAVRRDLRRGGFREEGEKWSASA